MFHHIKLKEFGLTELKKVTVPAINGYVFFELNKIDFNLININPFTKNIVKRY